MKIEDLPLPLRLRNALYKAGFSTDADVITWMNGPDADVPLRGVGSTGMLQLREWAAGATKAEPRGGPEVIRRPARREEPAERAEDYRRDDVVSPQGGNTPAGRWGQLAGDTSMRGGLESLAQEPDYADQALQQAVWMREREVWKDWTPARNHQWDSPAAPPADSRRTFVDPDEEIKRRGAEFRSAGGSVAAGNGRGTLILQLEAEIQDRLRAMIPTIKGLAHVKELGVEVSAETVARMALIRGLDALERAHNGGKEAQKAENAPSDPENREVSAAEPPSGVHATPEGWTKCGPTDKIPVAQAVIHDYYTQNNWFRYWGKAGDSVIYFYWSPEVQFQDLDVFPGTDKNGKTVAVQDTPWGPGHIVPINWANQ